MPLSAPDDRKRLHTRKIEFRGYERADGRFDIEGRVTDAKTYGFDNQDRNGIQAGEPIHDMSVRLTVNETFEVDDIEVSIDGGPFNICCDIEPAFKVLIGLKIGPGWYKQVKERIGGRKGCTHVVEMLGPIATATLQTMYPALARRNPSDPKGAKRPPSQINGCHALRTDGPLIKERYPEFYKEA